MKYLKIFTDFVEKIEPFNDTEVGRLFRAMLVYAETGTEENLRGNERFIWNTAKQEIDRQRESYEQTCKTNKRIATERYEALRSSTEKHEAYQDKEKDKDKKEKISTDVDIQKKPAVISLMLNDGTEYGVEQEAIEKWENLYPAVNVMQELRKMAGWLDANRTRRKTRRGIEAFIHRWLAREQDKGGVKRGTAGTDTATDGESNPFKKLKLGFCSDDFE